MPQRSHCQDRIRARVGSDLNIGSAQTHQFSFRERDKWEQRLRQQADDAASDLGATTSGQLSLQGSAAPPAASTQPAGMRGGIAIASPSSSRNGGNCGKSVESLPSLAARGAAGDPGDKSNDRDGAAGAGHREETLPSLAPVGSSLGSTKSALSMVCVSTCKRFMSGRFDVVCSD
jgi:hypothetical protein